MRGTCSTSPLGLRERRPDNTHGWSKAASTLSSSLRQQAHGPWFYTQIPIIYIRLLLIGLSLALSVLFFRTPVAIARSNGTQDLVFSIRPDRFVHHSSALSGRPPRPASAPVASARGRCVVGPGT